MCVAFRAWILSKCRRGEDVARDCVAVITSSASMLAEADEPHLLAENQRPLTGPDGPLVMLEDIFITRGPQGSPRS
jgi:hypothetical protein